MDTAFSCPQRLENGEPEVGKTVFFRVSSSGPCPQEKRENPAETGPQRGCRKVRECFSQIANGGEELDLKKRHTNGTTYLGARICVRNQLDENSPVID